MAHRLTDAQQKILAIVKAAVAPKDRTPLERHFAKELAKAALPPMPTRGRKTAAQYHLARVQWQCLAALAAGSHTSATELLKQEVLLTKELEAEKEALREVTPEQLVAEITARLPLFPTAVQEQMLRQLADLLGVEIVAR